MPKRGFTVIELMVVVAVIGLLGIMAVLAINGYRPRAFAAKMGADFRNLKTAATTWQAATGSDFRNDSTAGYGDGPAVCGSVTGNPGLSTTFFNSVASEKSGVALNQRAFNPINGGEYHYDNDVGCNPIPFKNDGVNIISYFCTEDVSMGRQVAAILDRNFDRGDGDSAGQILWLDEPTATQPFAIIYHIKPCPGA
jgi:prepilin-type N-terminal cleavage/methylation domain-containing protein